MEQEIIIDLSMTQEANDNLEMKHLLQQEAYEQLRTSITETVAKIPSFTARVKETDAVLRARTHDVIMLDGARGSGKTTFIINAQKLLRKKELEDVLFLNIIDPTLIETREHVFINIIGSIVNRVDAKRDKTTDTHFEDSYEKWRKTLNKLALGLSLLDGVGESRLSKGDWADEYYVLEEGIKKAQSGSSLETSFHKFVDESLSLLGAKAFLLVFDDIDTDFAKGWPVLELLRKYLTTPQIVTVLCGDLNLYTTLVAKQQWKNLGYSLSTSAGAAPNHTTIVNEVIKQYLFKILRTPRRIALKNIDHIRNARAISVCKQSDAQKNPIAPQELTPLLEKILGTLVGKQRKDDLSNTVTYITQKTPRELVNFLTTISRTTSDSWEMTSEEHVSGGIQALADLSFYALSNINYDKNNIYEKQEKLAAMHVLQGMVNAGIIESGAELAPRFMNVEKNDCAMVFAAHLSALARTRIATYFEYWLRINLPSLAYNDLNPTVLDLYGNNKMEVIRACIDHQSGLEGETLTNICRKYISFISRDEPSVGKNQKQKFGLFHGTLRIRSNGFKKSTEPLKEALFSTNSRYQIPDIGRSKNRFWGAFLNNARTLDKGITSWHRPLAMLPFSVNRDGDSSYVHFSIYNVLGALGGFLEATDAQQLFSTAGQLREYPVARAIHAPVSRQNTTLDVDEDDTLDNDQDTTDDASNIPLDEHFLALMARWKEHAVTHIKTPPAMRVASKAWTRFHYALKRVPEAIKAEDRLAGNILHRWVVLFLNSVLVEELFVAEKMPREKMPLEKNPTSSDINFEYNLILLLEDLSQAPFAAWLLSCPLWHHYTRHDTSVHETLLKLTHQQLEAETHHLRSMLAVTFNDITIKNLCLLHNTVACIGHDSFKLDKDNQPKPRTRSKRKAPVEPTDAPKSADQASDSNDSKAD